MDLMGKLEKIFAEKSSLELRPIRCCDSILKWGDFEEKGYSGFYADCNICSSEWVQKLNSNLFVRSEPRLYIRKKEESIYRHVPCGSEVKAVNYLWENENGVITNTFQERSLPVIGSEPYCPEEGCESLKRPATLASNIRTIPMSKAERDIAKILGQ